MLTTPYMLTRFRRFEKATYVTPDCIRFPESRDFQDFPKVPENSNGCLYMFVRKNFHYLFETSCLYNSIYGQNIAFCHMAVKIQSCKEMKLSNTPDGSLLLWHCNQSFPKHPPPPPLLWWLVLALVVPCCRIKLLWLQPNKKVTLCCVHTLE